MRWLGVLDQATPKRPAAPPTGGRRQAFPQLTKPKGEAAKQAEDEAEVQQPQKERAAQRLDDKNFGVSPRTRLKPIAFSKVAAAAKILKAEAEAAPPAAKKAKPPPAPPPTHLVPKAITDMAMHPPPKAKPTSLAASHWKQILKEAIGRQRPKAPAKKARRQACPQLTKAGGEKVAASKAALQPEKRRLQEKLEAAEAEAEEDWRHDLAMSFQKPRLAEAERQVNERKALLQEAETRIRQQKPGEDRMRMVVECMELKQQLKAAEKILDLEQQSTRRLQVTHRAAQVTREAGHDVQWERRIQARH